ncbi:MAG TPA: hypothetical protein VMW24_29160 [Sedimentisphaerales bacterium]|jgi:hypothetical protein|nr:hypothetical protein [Sedimentisphaerales bacterium]
MSPAVSSHGKKLIAPDNLYTVILALAFCAVLATAVFVAYRCYVQYGTIFSIQ